jgi:Uma2 family endonuclease
MSAAASATLAPQHIASKRRSPARKLPTTLADYLVWMPKDGYYYEWENGKLLKIDPMIYPHQLHIVKNLTRQFVKTTAYLNGDELVPEFRMATIDSQYRVPDMSYWTVKQQREHAAGNRAVSTFVVEIISKNDLAYDVEWKMEEYFEAGVRLVWHIFPETKKIYAFSSPYHVSVYHGDSICNAEEVIEGFSIPAKDIFKLP